MKRALFGALLLGVMLSGCFRWQAPVSESPLLLLTPAEYPVFDDDENRADWLKAIDHSLAALSKMPDEATQRYGQDVYTVSWIRRSLATLRSFLETDPSDEAIDRFVRKHFRVYRSIGRKGIGDVLFTGYFEPEIGGCPSPRPGCSTPVYGIPRDWVRIDLGAFSERFSGERIVGRLVGNTVVPYWERKEIENPKVFTSPVDILAWVEDPIDFFFLQVQGSGRIRFPNGERISIHYAASNGRPYRSIGKRLLEEGVFAQGTVSMQAIKAYLREHPERVQEILHSNPSYVFFETVPSGPIGSLGVPLTAGRSIAVDFRIFPKAAPAYIQCVKPKRTSKPEDMKPDTPAESNTDDWIPFGRFVLAQDTGGAITGPGRVDLFCGSGPDAEWTAGHLQHPGTLYLLVLKHAD